MNESESFKNKIDNLKLRNVKNELIEVLTMGIDQEVIYSALRVVYEIVLKAAIVKNRNGVISMSFQYVDMENAVIPVRILAGELINKGLSKINALEKCFRIIKENYEKSASTIEYASKMGMVRNNNPKAIGEIGTYYNFNSISEDSWEFIKDYINDRIEI